VEAVTDGILSLDIWMSVSVDKVVPANHADILIVVLDHVMSVGTHQFERGDRVSYPMLRLYSGFEVLGIVDQVGNGYPVHDLLGQSRVVKGLSPFV